MPKRTTSMELQDHLKEEIARLSAALDEQEAVAHPGGGSTRGLPRGRERRERPVGPEFYPQIGKRSTRRQRSLVVQLILTPLRLVQRIGSLLRTLLILPAEWRRERRAQAQIKQHEQRRQQVMALSTLSREALSTRLKRLQQFDRWLVEDPELTTLIDSTLKHRVEIASRRQTALTLVVAVVSLVAGWVLNTLSPGTLLAGFLHH